MSTPLHRLNAAGQSIWLDYIDREMLRNGDLARRIREDALTGMTSNPTIFEKAMAEGTEYDEQLRAAPASATGWELFELVAASDVRDACDAFADVYSRTQGNDGFVSIEVSPGAANDTEETVVEARRLWALVDRPNVMIKVPGTDAGAHALERLIAEGINVNVTLLFAIDAHRRIIEGYIRGIERRVDQGLDVSRVRSVASFFVSRVDTEIDARLAALAKDADPEQRPELESLAGKAAIANAKLAYALFQREFSTDRWRELEGHGAAVQRPLWASTSTKNPAYRDVIYVEELIGPDTVNTMPPQTLVAFRDHGIVERTVDRNLDDAERVMSRLDAAGISMSAVTDKLLGEGLASFQRSFDSLVAGLARKRESLGHNLVPNS